LGIPLNQPSLQELKMGKKKPLFGVNTYIRRTRKKRPGRHAKSVSKRVPNKSKYRGQGR